MHENVSLQLQCNRYVNIYNVRKQLVKKETNKVANKGKIILRRKYHRKFFKQFTRQFTHQFGECSYCVLVRKTGDFVSFYIETADKSLAKMSHHASTSNNNDKAEPLTKEEWQSRLESFEFKQADMNKLIMNYLVTGKYFVNQKSIFSDK